MKKNPHFIVENDKTDFRENYIIDRIFFRKTSAKTVTTYNQTAINLIISYLIKM